MRVGGPAARLVRVDTTDELVDAVHEVDDAGRAAARPRRRVQPRGRRRGLPRHRGAGRDDRHTGRVRRPLRRRQRPRRGRRAVGRRRRPRRRRRGGRGSRRSPASPARPAPRRSRTSAPTARRSPRRSPRYASGTGAPARCARSSASDCGFTYRDSRFKRDPTRFVVLDVLFQLRVADLSEPVRYADLARSLGVELGARVPLADARAAVLEQRRRRGMVLDAADHDTWSCGSFFTNPILLGRGHGGAGRPGPRPARRPTLPTFRSGPNPTAGVKTSAAWLIERAGFEQGLRDRPAQPPSPTSTPWP